MTARDLERKLDDAGSDMLPAYDWRCCGCGAFYSSPVTVCELCGCGEFEETEDLAW
jgi:rRNA maturation endonuclease Nob1